jgi:hypothetical protein
MHDPQQEEEEEDQRLKWECLFGNSVSNSMFDALGMEKELVYCNL